MPFVVPFRRPDLIGREAALEALHGRLGEGDVALTPALTGQGGIGKTQLAALYAHAYAACYEGGVFWLNCADPRPEALLGQVADAFARELDLASAVEDPRERDRDLAEAWFGRVSGRRDVLLVADNLERPELLTADFAGVANRRLGALGVTLLMTSRSRGLPGCADVEVERLAEPEALALLLRSAELDAKALDFAERAAAARVARRMGGLPLTLRLSGALRATSGAGFGEIAEALARDGVIELFDAEMAPWPLEDYGDQRPAGS